MARGGDPPRGRDRRFRARSQSPPPADGRAGAISRAVRRSAAAAPGRGHSSSPRRDDGEVSSRPPSSPPQLESLRVASLMLNSQPQAKTVHPHLRMLLSRALAQLRRATSIDGEALEEFLRKISDILQQADFRPEMVADLRSRVKSAVDLAGDGSKDIICKAFNKELCRLIDAGKKPSFIPKKGKPCVVLVTGLRGSGKTISSIKFAYHHQLKGFKPSLICADTRGDRAFDRLKNIAQEFKIPCYGSCTEVDSAKIAVQGVDKFRKENSDLIIIDATGNNISEDTFFSEISEIDNATKPNLIILVVDAGVGNSAFDQAQMFKGNLSVGSAIVTKMDYHSNGSGALNALAAARLPVILLGTGRRIQEFEIFDVKLFSNRLLDHNGRSISIDTEDMHNIYDNLKLSESERKSAMDEVEEECYKACNAVLDKQKLLIQQIRNLESKCKKVCYVLGEKDLQNDDIQSAITLKERHSRLLTSLKSLERERNSRIKKLQVLLTKGLASLDMLGVTNLEQRKYKSMLENLSSPVQEANILSTKSLETLETRVKELEVKKAQHADKSRDEILRQGEIFIRMGGTGDRGGLEGLIKMVVAWESKHGKAILHGNQVLLDLLRKMGNNVPLLSSDIPLNGDATTSDTEMVHSASSRSDTDMGTSSSGSSSSDPNYSPDSEESDIDMGRLVVPESPDLM